VDLAKYNDWTVCTPFDLTTFKVGEQLRFNQIDWALQKSRIEAFARKYNNAKVVVDSTGIGDPIAEDLQRTGLNVESFKFTESSKRQILDNLQILLAQNKIRIPKDEGLIGELRSMQFSMTENGKINIKVPSGITDDRIMSLALAVKGGTTPIFSMKGMDFGLYSQDFN
jgi:phage FluMu gp28-like protein